MVTVHTAAINYATHAVIYVATQLPKQEGLITNATNMEKSESIKEIATALLKFQANVENVKKDESNPYFKSKYGTLENILDTVRADKWKSARVRLSWMNKRHSFTYASLRRHPRGEGVTGAGYDAR